MILELSFQTQTLNVSITIFDRCYQLLHNKFLTVPALQLAHTISRVLDSVKSFLIVSFFNAEEYDERLEHFFRCVWSVPVFLISLAYKCFRIGVNIMLRTFQSVFPVIYRAESRPNERKENYICILLIIFSGYYYVNRIQCRSYVTVVTYCIMLCFIFIFVS